MGDLVNLRRFRKARDRVERAEGAARNRAAFGRTRDERNASAGEVTRADAKLDAHRRDAPVHAAGDDAPGDGPAG